MGLFDELEEEVELDLREAIETIKEEEIIRDVVRALRVKGGGQIDSTKRLMSAARAVLREDAPSAGGRKGQKDRWVIYDPGRLRDQLVRRFKPPTPVPEDLDHPVGLMFLEPGAYSIPALWEQEEKAREAIRERACQERGQEEADKAANRFAILSGWFRNDGNLISRLSREGAPKGVEHRGRPWCLIIPDALETIYERENLSRFRRSVAATPTILETYKNHPGLSFFLDGNNS